MPSYMNTPEFRTFRSEDDDITTEPKLKELARVYIAKAENLKVDAEPMKAVRDYFTSINASIRALEAAELAAEPKHLQSLLTFAEKASRRPLAAGERNEIVLRKRQPAGEGLVRHDADGIEIAGAVTEAEVRRWCEARLSAYKQPSVITITR